MTKLKKVLLSLGLTLILTGLVSGWVTYILYIENEAAPVSLPGFYVTTDNFLWDRGYVTANGTWVMEAPDMMANPIRTSKIVCILRDRVCRESTAEITNYYSKVLNLEIDLHDILKWESDQIAYTNDSSICNIYYYYINRVTKQVTGVRKPKKDAPKDVCGDSDKREIKLNLVNGFDIYRDARQKSMSSFARLAPLVIFLMSYLYFLWYIWRRLGRNRLQHEIS
jgi:hypothetical protein